VYLSKKMDIFKKIPCAVIHREQDKERLPLIYQLEREIGRHLQIFEALDGTALADTGFPTRHPLPGQKITPGIIGCVASHVELIEAALKRANEFVCIFEDDAEVVGDLEHYLTYVAKLPTADVICFGTNEIVDGEPTPVPSIAKVTRFWGTHAIMINRKAMHALLMTYHNGIKKGILYPADWLYNTAIKEYGLIAYAPIKSVIKQKSGLVSSINGRIR